MKVSVIIPAAGASKRFGRKTKKIFERIKGQPVFIRAIELFVNRNDVCEVQLVVAEEDKEVMRTRYAANIGFMGVKLVSGGDARTESVRNALEKVSDDAEYVCVHDAARPCVSQLWIDEVFAAAEKFGSAILDYPLHGTLKKVGGGNKIDRTLSRENLWEAQTPQVFRKDILVRAYKNAKNHADDDAALVEALGEPVAVVTGDPRNVKITKRSDLALAEAVVGSLPKPKLAKPAGPFEEAQW
ncbi:MAG: 2-C-methyl-D-erythritol 4-phosphate cytidylyltransferase [Phycisphaerae bacterium]|nr:2-C-methyl-D-erythritol 4-phosphate cytidylyltransferase [Phycisphaerae bacterium]